MFDLILGLTARTYFAVRRFMPTNVVLDALHTRRGLKWGVPAMLLAVPYVFAMIVCVGMVESGGPGWLNVLALLCVWNAVKFLVAGPVAVLQLVTVRAREPRMRRRSAQAKVSGGDETHATEPELSSRRV